MALSKLKKAKFAAIMLMNRTVFKVLKFDIYGVRILGIQFTPKATADILKIDGDFSNTQKENFNIKLWFNTYVFLPKLA